MTSVICVTRAFTFEGTEEEFDRLIYDALFDGNLAACLRLNARVTSIFLPEGGSYLRRGVTGDALVISAEEDTHDDA